MNLTDGIIHSVADLIVKDDGTARYLRSCHLKSMKLLDTSRRTRRKRIRNLVTAILFPEQIYAIILFYCVTAMRTSRRDFGAADGRVPSRSANPSAVKFEKYYSSGVIIHYSSFIERSDKNHSSYMHLLLKNAEATYRQR
jgi:hypothetical protein